MIWVSEVRVTPPEVRSGELVEITATITFAGPPREVTVTVSVQPPCTFDGSARTIELVRHEVSPHTVRVVERVWAPAGEDAWVPRISVEALDGRGEVGVAGGRLVVLGAGGDGPGA
jgi:hypothetical protein